MRKFCKRQDVLYRDAGRKLSAWRDAAVLVETLNKVQEKFAPRLAGESLSSVSGFLVRRKKRALAERSAVESTLREAAAILLKSRESLPELRAVQSICPGMKADYRAARKAFLHAYRHEGDVSFHEWRKTVKRYLYHVELVEKFLPESWKHHRKSLKHLADLLGDDHNLAVLNETLRRRESSLPPLIDEWQKELRAEAAPLGAKAFGETARQFGEIFEKIWRQRHAPIQEEPFLVRRASA